MIVRMILGLDRFKTVLIFPPVLLARPKGKTCLRFLFVSNFQLSKSVQTMGGPAKPAKKVVSPFLEYFLPMPICSCVLDVVLIRTIRELHFQCQLLYRPVLFVLQIRSIVASLRLLSIYFPVSCVR